MRISTAQMQSKALNAMLDRQTELSYTQEQVATGKRILSPKDDVLGTTQALTLQQQIDTHQQYQENADRAEERLITEETALNQVVTVLQRAQELAVQSSNSTLTASSRAGLAQEVRQQIDQVLGQANSKDNNGDYLFAGHNIGTAPFVAVENPPGSGRYDYNYTGDLGQRNLQIGATRQIPVGDPGSDVFNNVPLSGGGSQDLIKTLEQFAVDLESNTVNPATADDFKTAIDHMGQYLAKVGARLNAIDNDRNFNADVVLQGQKTLSDIQDLDLAEAISRMNLQLTGLQAAQQSFSRIQNLSLFNYI